MSGSLTLAMRTAQSGLQSNQEALNAISNNIANVNTPGYSRKIVNMQSRVVGGAGAGVQVADVARKVDEGLIKSVRIELSTLNKLNVQDPYYQRLQELFGRPQDNTSLSHLTTAFSNTVEELALNPTSTINQSAVMTQARQLTLTTKHMSDTIQELRLQTDADIATATKRVGTLLTSIHTINNQLIANTAVNVDVTDLRDQRDSALDELSTLIDVRYYYRADGDAIVFTEGGRTLVDNTPISVTHTPASAISSTTNHSEGDLNGIYVGDAISTNDITTELLGGKLKGLVELRDNVLTNMQSQLDEYTGQLRDTVNAVNNAGSSFPGQQSLTGTREFIDSANQTLTFTGNSDTTLAMVDSLGNQTSVTTIRTLLGSATGTIDTIASKMQTWIRANGATGATVAVDANGHLAMNLNTTTTNFVMRDEAATANGSTAQDATLTFDANAGGANGTETVSGFSNFFGLNDYFVDNLGTNMHDSNILSSTYTLPAGTTMTFYNKTSGVAGAGLGSVNLTATQTLDQMVTTINAAAIGVTASKVPDGSGYRLRFSESNGLNMVVSASTTFTSDIGLKVANVRTSGALKVRDDIVATPGKISRGTLQWDATKGAAGEYLMSNNDDSTIRALAVSLTATHTFKDAGGLTSLQVNFSSYSSSIIGNNATLSSDNQAQLSYQQTLTDSLTAKSDNFRGVNMDEEMTHMMMFQQAYGASARIISTIQKMFDTLEAMI